MLLCRQEKPGKEYWLLPGGGVKSGETLVQALRRELARGARRLATSDPVRGTGRARRLDRAATELATKHVVHIIFAATSATARSRPSTSHDAAVRGHRLFSLDELDGVVVHPPIQRFLQRWRPGDPAVYLGALWAR